MKKLLLQAFFGIFFLGVSRSFAAGEGPGRMVAAGIFAAQLARENNLTLEQQEEVSKMLEVETNRDGDLPENVARDMFADWQQGQARGGEVEEKEAESVPQLHMPASIDVLTKYAPGKYQELPPEVIANIDSYMSFAPREWRVDFEPGQLIKQFALLDNIPHTDSSVYSLAASADGRYMGVAYSNIIVIWDMQQASNKPAYTVRIDGVDPVVGLDSLAFGKGGLIGYTGYSSNETAPIKQVIGVWTIEEGRQLWHRYSEKNEISGFGWLAFSTDGKRLSWVKGGAYADLEEIFVWNALTGQQDEKLSQLDKKKWRYGSAPLLSGLQTTRTTAFSFDGEKKVEVSRLGIKIEQLSSGLIKVMQIELNDPPAYKLYPRVALSPKEDKVGVVIKEEENFDFYICDVARDRLQPVNSVKATGKKIIGITFSSKGKYLMWAIYDEEKESISIEIYDVVGTVLPTY